MPVSDPPGQPPLRRPDLRDRARLDVCNAHSRAELSVRLPGMALGMWAGRGDYASCSEESRDESGRHALVTLDAGIAELVAVREQLAAAVGFVGQLGDPPITVFRDNSPDR